MKLGKGLLSPARSQNKRKGGGGVHRTSQGGMGGGGEGSNVLEGKENETKLTCSQFILYSAVVRRNSSRLAGFTQMFCFALLFYSSQYDVLVIPVSTKQSQLHYNTFRPLGCTEVTIYH